MRKIISLLTLLILISSIPASASSWWIFGKKKKKKKEQIEAVDTTKTAPSKSKYATMFLNDKNVVTAKGDFITIHKTRNKLYFEFPIYNLNREMLIATTITQTSDAEYVTPGYKHNEPIHVRFSLADSTVYMNKINIPLEYNKQDNATISEAVKMSSLDPLVQSFDIICTSDDNVSVVFEVTDLFLNGGNLLSPFSESGSSKSSNNFKKNTSRLGKFKSFEDNAMIKSYLSYDVTSKTPLGSSSGKPTPLTIEVTRTLLLLPYEEDRMRSRLADLRLGTFLTHKKILKEDEDKISYYSMVNRWRLEPKDTAAYLRGDLTEPIKPIVFYLDSAFPESWKDPAREGITRWNAAFEAIGFKNAVQIKDYPENDPEFDPDNLKYSCIRYVPTNTANAMGPSWVDPNTGEIISASVIVWNDVARLINNWRFIQTSQIDPSVRAKKLPDDIMGESLAYVLAHEVGHCLGFMHNMSASAAYPVDSLRSVTFTQQHGTTPSIMDYARFNYVAQPEDKGVKLDPPNLGPYDYYLVEYAYKPLLEAKTMEQEKETLETLVDSKVGNPVYRYGNQQIISRYDPSAIEEDLGDDPMKAGDYGIKNLKYILSNLNNWISNEEDPDMSHRRTLYSGIIGQYSRYIRASLMNVGGIYLNKVKAGTHGDTYKVVPRDVQKKSLAWVMKQLQESAWLNDKENTTNFPLRTSASAQFIYNIGEDVFNAYRKVMLASHVSQDSFTVKEFFDDLYNHVWQSALWGRATTLADRQLQEMFVNKVCGYLDTRGFGASIRISMLSDEEAYAPSVNEILAFNLDESGYVEKYQNLLREIELREGKAELINHLENEIEFGYGYGWQSAVNLRDIDNSQTLFYAQGQRILNLLRSQLANSWGESRDHYRAMIFKLESAMSTSN